MKHTFILICVILGSLQTMATNLVLEQRSGAEVLQDVAIIGQWVFVENTIQLLDKSGNILATEPIANIKKIQFATNGTNADVNDTVVRTIIVYPNPTQDILMIQGAESQMLRVYNLQGSLLQTEWGNQITVSHLLVLHTSNIMHSVIVNRLIYIMLAGKNNGIILKREKIG